MALQYVGGTSNAGTGASYTVSLNGTLTGGLASSPAAGDIVVVFSGFGNTASVAPTCTGNNSGTYDNASAALYSNDTWDTNFRAFYKVQGSTPDTSLTIGRVNNTTYGGATTVHVWRGVNTTTPLDVTTTTASASNQSSAALNPPAITPVTSGSIVIAGGAGTMPAAGTAGYTAIGTMSNTVTQYGNGSTADTSLIMASFAWTSGPYDPVTATGGTQNNTSSSWAGVTLALRPQPNPITGNLAATESGADTASAAGDVVVQGSASASEAATEDVFVASGALSSGIAGDLAATESGTDAASSSGDVFVTGTMSATESGSDTAALSGDVFVAGALSASEAGSDTATASGDVVVAGSLSAAEVGQDAAALSGVLLVQGDLVVAESGEDVFNASSISGVSGDMAAVESGEDVAQFIQEQVIQAQRRAGGRRGYIFKGKKYWLNQVELAQLIREEQALIQDVQRLKRNKPKTISADTAKAIEAIIATLNLPIEAEQPTITPQIDNDDDEVMELLLTL